MAAAANLEQAAGQSFDNLFALWVAGGNTFKTKVAAFASALLPTFPNSDVTGRPIANWLTLIAGVAFTMPSVGAGVQVDYNGFFIPTNDYIYRICWLAAKPTSLSPNITPAQQAAVLTAYNANF